MRALFLAVAVAACLACAPDVEPLEWPAPPAGIEAPPQSYTVERVDVEPVEAAGIRRSVPPGELVDAMTELFPAISLALGKQRVEQAGPPFAVFHRFGDDRLDVTFAIPVASDVREVADLRRVRLDGGAAAATWHEGPYGSAANAHSAVMAWCARQGLVAAGAPVESYVTDPGSENDPTRWRTRVIHPLND